jgi:hypothetical protein
MVWLVIVVIVVAVVVVMVMVVVRLVVVVVEEEGEADGIFAMSVGVDGGGGGGGMIRWSTDGVSQQGNTRTTHVERFTILLEEIKEAINARSQTVCCWWCLR